jgi:ketol-acid reductoisomerase
MAKMYYDKDADLRLIQGKKVAVIGWFVGHAHAGTSDSGASVKAGLPATSRSRPKAQAAGPRWGRRRRVEVGRRHMVLVPDTTAAKPKEAIEPNLAPGKLLFAHGFNIRFGIIARPGRRRRDGGAEGAWHRVSSTAKAPARPR